MSRVIITMKEAILLFIIYDIQTLLHADILRSVLLIYIPKMATLVVLITLLKPEIHLILCFKTDICPQFINLI